MLTTEFFGHYASMQSYTVCRNEYFSKCSVSRHGYYPALGDVVISGDSILGISRKQKSHQHKSMAFTNMSVLQLDLFFDPGSLTVLAFQVVQLSSAYAS